MSTFFLHAFFPFLLACLNWDGAPSVECGFLAVIEECPKEDILGVTVTVRHVDITASLARQEVALLVLALA